jgi:hypothetical protein
MGASQITGEWPIDRLHDLSEEEIRTVNWLHRRTSDADARSRCDMILWASEWLSPPEVAGCVRFGRER